MIFLGSENNFACGVVCFVLFLEFFWSNYLKIPIPVLLKVEAASSSLRGPLEDQSSDAINRSELSRCGNIHRGPSLYSDKGLIWVSLEDSEFKKIFTSINVCTCVCVYT